MALSITDVTINFSDRIPLNLNGTLNYKDSIWSTGTAQGDPTAIRVPAPQDSSPLALKVTFTFNFQDRWTVPGSKFIMSGAGSRGAVIVSSPCAINGSGSVNMKVSDFKLVSPAALTVPFADRGNWTWKLKHIPPTGKNKGNIP